MDNFVNTVKAMLRDFFDGCSKPKQINSTREYRHVKKWLKKICILYAAFSVLALIESLICISGQFFFQTLGPMSYIIVPPLLFLTNLGYATLITYLPDVIKSVTEAGKTGYEIGQNIETTHVHVTHEFGNSYRVSSYTENKGCLFALIAGVIRFMIWAFFCVYIGPFLTFKKITGSVKNIKNYNAN